MVMATGWSGNTNVFPSGANPAAAFVRCRILCSLQFVTSQRLYKKPAVTFSVFLAHFFLRVYFFHAGYFCIGHIERKSLAFAINSVDIILASYAVHNRSVLPVQLI